ncbi:flavodoxin-like fold protein [Balamuthia mandrillaris]
MVKVVIVFHSFYTHAWVMAQAIAEGAKQVVGVEVEIYQVSETVPPEVLDKMGATGAKQAMKDVPFIDSDREKMIEILSSADALIIGGGTRFGVISAQLKTFLDSLSGLFISNGLVGKVASAFTGTASQHGGNEMTLFSLIVPLLHLGLVYAGLPYTCNEQRSMEEITGGSPYGSTYITGADGSRPVSENEKACGRAQGKHVAELAAKLKKGSQ